ncbi:MAG: glutathione S-transferase family protein [Mesorhizobium sp.]
MTEPRDRPVLYHSEMSPCAAKVRMLLSDKGIEWESRLLDLRAGDAQKPDYVELNPNKVVPTLVVGSDVVIESNIILEYIEDRWPTPSVRPSKPAQVAQMRLWMKRLDDGIHAATATVSVCIALRYQFLNRTPQELQHWLENISDPARRIRSKAAIEQGMDAPQFTEAVLKLRDLYRDFDDTLAKHEFLAGGSYSLADLAFSPYLLRFEQLGFCELTAARPRIVEWSRRLFDRPSYKAGVIDFLNPGAVALFEREAPEARMHIAEILERNAIPARTEGLSR